MKKLRKLVSVLLAVSMCAATSATVLAKDESPELGPDITVSVNEYGETVYTQTIDLADATPLYLTPMTKTVTGDSSLGIALDPGKSDFSKRVDFRFTTLDKNARVRSVEFIPGRYVINNNNKNMLGLVKFNKLFIVDPDNHEASLVWNQTGVTDTTHFLNKKARGTWQVYVYATNLTDSVGNYEQDLWRAGNLIYSSPQLKITYVIDPSMTD